MSVLRVSMDTHTNEITIYNNKIRDGAAFILKKYNSGHTREFLKKKNILESLKHDRLRQLFQKQEL